MNEKELNRIINLVVDHTSNSEEISTITKELIMRDEKRANKYLLERLRDYGDKPELKKHLVFALGVLGETSSKDVLLDILYSKENHWELKRKTILALGYLRVTEVVDYLISIIRNNSPHELVNPSVVSLGYISDTRAIQILMKCLASDVRYLPRTAAEALGRYGKNGVEALPALEELVIKGNAVERKFAEEAITQIMG